MSLSDGFGVERWVDNSSFEGEFWKGQKSGHGVYHWPDKSDYAGQWKGNAIGGMAS